MLKFLVNYLCGRQQCVIIENVTSTSKEVFSDVLQGSILGPILFVLFINDMADGIDCNTDLALYADDTKIWRKIMSEKDHIKFQTDINYLLMWSINNKINFNFDKCKALSVSNRLFPIAMLPFVTIFYYLGDKMQPFVDSEKDLGVIISSNFSFNKQCENVVIYRVKSLRKIEINNISTPNIAIINRQYNTIGKTNHIGSA